MEGGMLKCCVIAACLVWGTGHQTGDGRAIAEKLWTPVLRLRKNMTERESLSRVNAPAYYNCKDEGKKEGHRALPNEPVLDTACIA